MPRELLIALLSASPFLELKGGIPLGKILGLPIEAAIFWSVLGNMLPVPMLLKYLHPAGNWLMKKSPWFNKFLTKVFETTRSKHAHRIIKYGALVLIPVTALPFPGSGAWTAAVIAYLFAVPFKKALPLILAGIALGAIIVSLLVESAIRLPGLFT